MKKKIFIAAFLVFALIVFSEFVTGLFSKNNYSKGLQYEIRGSTICITGIGTCTDENVIIPPKIKAKSVDGIDYYAFKGCENIKSITIPNTVEYIGGYAFEGCTGLTSITLPHNLGILEDRTFYNCTNLTSITIPESVKIIRKRVFGDFMLLSKINYTGTTEQWDKINKDPFWNDQTICCTIHCTDGDVLN